MFVNDNMRITYEGDYTPTYLPKDVINWTTEEVADWARRDLDFDDEDIALLMEAKLNGRKLLRINDSEELVKMKFVLGPILDLRHEIYKLRKLLSKPGVRK